MKRIVLIIIFCISFINADDLEKVSLQLKWKYQFQFAGFIVAQEKGFYKDAGLNVELKEFTKDIKVVSDVVSGKIDFGISDSALVYNALQNQPVTALMAVFQHSPFILMGLNNGKINSIEDLNGKRISLYDGIDGISIKAMLKTKNINYIPYSSVFFIDKLLSGEVDMMTSYISNELFVAKEQNIDIVTFKPKDYGFEGYGDILFTSKKMAKENPKLVKKFYDASHKGWEYAYSNIDEVVNLIHEKYNTLDKTKKALHYEANILKKLSGYGKNIGEINLEKIKSIAQQFNLIKNEHNKLDILNDFVSPLNQNIKNQKIVNIMLGIDKPPFIFGQSSSKGIEADLLKEAFSLVNYQVKISQGKKSTQEKVLYAENDIDGVATISQKNKGLYYSDEFTVYENYVITRKTDNIIIDTIEDLKNIKFVTWKTAYNDLGDKFYKLYNPKDGIYKESYNDTSTQIDDAKMFFSKKVDAIIVDKTIFNWHKLYFNNNEKYTFHKIFNTKKSYPVVFRNKDVRDDFNIGLNILKENGRYDEIIKFYETQDIKELMTLTSLVSDISAKYIFNDNRRNLKEILSQFLIHPDIKGISVTHINDQETYLQVVKKDGQLVDDNLADLRNLQNIKSKIYYKTGFDLLDLGEITLFYTKTFQTKNGKVIPALSNIKSADNLLLKELYLKYKLSHDISLSLTKLEKEYLSKHKTITVHNEDNWAPYNYNKKGIATGFSIDYMDLIAEKLDINIKYVHGYEWKDFLDLIQKEKIDVIANITQNKRRENYINFTTPYITSKKAIFSNLPDIKSISDLNGKTVALPEQFYTQNFLEQNYPNIKIKTFKNTKDSLYAVINKEADALIENFAVVKSLMQQNAITLPYVTLNDDKELTSSLHIGVRKSQTILRDIIEKAKKTITEEEFINLETKWFGLEKQEDNLYTEKELDYIENKKSINVCYHKDQHPWIMKIDNQMKGSSVEFLKYITKKSNLNFNMIENETVSNHFQKIKDGECDIAPIIVTKPNKFKFLTPTVSMIEDNIVLVTKINEPFLSDFGSIGNKKIAIHKGKKNLIQYVKSIYPNIKLSEVDKIDLDRVISGEFYGYISTSYKMSYKIYPHYFNQLKIMSKIGDKKLQGSFGVTVREPLLLSIFNKSLYDMTELERQEIKNAWVSVEVEKQFEYVLFLEIVSVFLVILLILIIFTLKQKKLQKKIQILNDNLEESIKIEVQKNREKDKLMLSQSRLAQMGEIISMIAHQWRQPLNSLSLLNQTVLLKYERGKLNDQSIDFFRIHSKKQIHEMSKTIDDFRDFFKPEKVKIEFSLNKMIIETIALVKPIFISNNISIQFDEQVDYNILGYENELGQAILNILNNAKDVLIEKKIEKKEIQIVIEKTTNNIILSITDNAGGIPSNIIDNIFDPYFSTKTEKNGTGLGLYMTKMIIEEHMKGKISVFNSVNGARFEIILKDMIDTKTGKINV
jgi:polar amino acid transport system substrate-binding protein